MSDKRYRIVHRHKHGGFITKGTSRADAHRLCARLGYDSYAVFNMWTRRESKPGT